MQPVLRLQPLDRLALVVRRKVGIALDHLKRLLPSKLLNRQGIDAGGESIGI